MDAKEEYEARKHRQQAERDAKEREAREKEALELRQSREREEFEARERVNQEKAAATRATADADAKRWWFEQKNPIDRFTGWLVVWTALLFIATIGNAIILYYTDEKIGEQAKISNRQLTVMENDKRPWLSADVAINKFVDFTEWGETRGINIPLKFTVKNYGQMPAVNVRAGAEIWPHPGNPKRKEILPLQKKLCEGAIRDADKDPIGGVAVFPSDSGVIEESVGVSGGEIYKGNGPILWAVFGCIDYTYNDGKHGQTGFNFVLGKAVEGFVVGLPFVEGTAISSPSEDQVKAGFPSDPLKRARIPVADVWFTPADSGNYAK